MDILNWVYLLKNKLVKTTVQDPAQDLLVIGNNVTFAKRGDKYQSYGMTVEDFAAYVASTAGTQMNYTTGLLSPQVQSDFISLPDTITDAWGTTFNTYKLGGIANFSAPGTSTYSYLIGVISGDSKLALINDASVIGANVNTYDQVSGKFAVNAYVRDQASGNIAPLTFATIVLDNTIASPNDYFVSIVATAGASWEGKAYIDIEFMSDQVLAYYN